MNGQEKSASTINDAELTAKLDTLRTDLKRLESVVIAFSGGVDSTFLLHVAVEQLGDRALAVTADSETIPRAELDQTRQMAESIGARHLVVTTHELVDPDFVANPPDRCYHCKKTLFGTLTEVAEREGVGHIAEGSNLDDLSDYRPGMKAVAQYKILSPLKEAGLTKEEIRQLSHRFGLPTWDKPAAPCLSSRIPYGSEITLDKLRRIELAEKFIRDLGFPVLRVRDHGQVARIEVPREVLSRFLDDGLADTVTEKLKSFGYQYVTVDLRGFRSGSLNETLKETGDGQGRSS